MAADKYALETLTYAGQHCSHCRCTLIPSSDRLTALDTALDAACADNAEEFMAYAFWYRTM